MQLCDFDYALPPELIAQQPLLERDASRMMVIDRARGTFTDHRFRELASILEPGDLMVFNNTRVIPARLLGRRRGTRSQPIGKGNPAAREYLTGKTELLLTRREGDDIWQGLVHPGRKVRTGEVLVFGREGELQAEVLRRGERGLRRVRLVSRRGTVDEAIERLGHVPLPPYIDRRDEPRDREAYQTVFARVPGAVAAPTAGLHFSERVLAELRSRGVETSEITLHVGPGTFRPVHAERIEEHRMDPELFEIGPQAAARINAALTAGRHVVAIGTTTVRVLEDAMRARGGPIDPGSGETSLFIYPGFRFRVVGALLTNFHLPRSTLLMLVAAFAGRELTLNAYRHAVEERYRFYSYGDCMLIV